VSHQLGNLLDCPTHLVADRKAVLQRVYDQLIASPDAVLDFRGGLHRYDPDELANWTARQVIADALQAFPASAAPLSEPEPDHEEPVEEPAE